jgi:hypothetical protein
MANLSDRITNDPFAKKLSPNLLINGGFDIWQRTISLTGVGYGADRWWIPDRVPDLFFLQSDIVPDESAPYSALIISDGINVPEVYTTIELSNPADGPAPFTPSKDYVLSFWAKRVNTDPFQIEISFVDAVGSAVNQIIILTTEAPATANVWEYVTVPFNIDAFVPAATNLALQIRLTAINDVNAGEVNMNLALVKLEVGTKATTFTRSGNTLAGELGMCQRYFQNRFMGVGKFSGLGEQAACYGVFPVKMRVAPTVSLRAGNPIQIDDVGGAIHTAASIPSSNVSPSSALVNFALTVDATGDAICAVNGIESYLNVDAEL